MAVSSEFTTFLERSWMRILTCLGTASQPNRLPGGNAIAVYFAAFQTDVLEICTRFRLDRHELTFSDYGNVVRLWLTSLHAISTE